ncbi:MAG: electron transfer flavoprotein subunit alpha/FixB family protein [Saprospiraceae bacterium]
MAVLVFAETAKNSFKKAAFEAVTYGAKAAASLGTECIALVIGDADNAAQLGNYGASKVLQVAGVDAFDSQVYATAVAEAAKQTGASLVVMSHTSTGKSILGRVGVKLDAGTVPGVNALPSGSAGSMTFGKPVFSGKAFAQVAVSSPVAVISLMGNSLPPENNGGDATVEAVSYTLPAAKVRVKSVERVEGITPLPEAELVVSAGRGVKDPGNWGIIEQLADVLHATTACSRPVADAGWRPHHEHVGQTGVAILPNLYIAIGISGAIQHLAGVNSSKVIVVINKDPEAPFFKAADYGVVGDLFDVVPKLTAAIEKYQTQN